MLAVRRLSIILERLTDYRLAARRLPYTLETDKTTDRQVVWRVPNILKRVTDNRHTSSLKTALHLERLMDSRKPVTITATSRKNPLNNQTQYKGTAGSPLSPRSLTYHAIRPRSPRTQGVGGVMVWEVILRWGFHLASPRPFHAVWWHQHPVPSQWVEPHMLVLWEGEGKARVMNGGGGFWLHNMVLCYNNT